MKPHLWTMFEEEKNADLFRVSYGARPINPPHCKHCGIDSVSAQQQQPDTKGVGPCPKAP
jgi:hypothetical protein